MTDAKLEEIGYAEVLHRFERGDYHDPAELKTVKRWMGGKDKERKFLADCERASISAALEANRAAGRAGLIAFLGTAYFYLQRPRASHRFCRGSSSLLRTLISATN